MRPHIFISHHHDDALFAELLRRRVEDGGFPVWSFKEGLRAGDHWHFEIDEAIRRSMVLIAVMSPGANGSRYVTYEWAFAMGASVPVLPIMLVETPLHPKLSLLQYLDFTKGEALPWENLIRDVRAKAARVRPAAPPRRPSWVDRLLGT